MIRSLSLSILLPLSFLQGLSNDIFDRARLEGFYTEFMCAQKNIDASVGLSNRCTLIPTPFRNCGNFISPPSYPTITLPDQNDTNYFPLVILNDTGQPDSEVYFTIFGNNSTNCGVQGASVVLDYSSSNYGSYQPTAGFPTNTYISGYSYPLSLLAKTTDTVTGIQYSVIYIPAMNNSEMLFSIGGALQLFSNGSSNLTVPQYTNTSDPNYNLVYQDLECTFYPDCNGATPQFTMDVTCVDSYGFSVALQAYQSPGVINGPSTGIYQSRDYVLCQIENAFARAFGTASQDTWDTLILRNGSKILRVVSPGYSASFADVPQPSHFDTNYWNNPAYGFSWSNDVWTNQSGYYGSQGNSFTVTTSSGNTYKGVVTSIPAYNLGFYSYPGGTGFVFTLQGTGTNIETDTKFYIPWIDDATNFGPSIPSPYPGFNTSTALLETATVFPVMAYSTPSTSGPVLIPPATVNNTTIDATVITQIFGGAIVAGLIPGVVSSLAFTPGPTPEQVALYYLPNTNLTSPGSSTGPWNSLYSDAILGNYLQTGNAAYAYAYDDYLYSNPTVLKVTAQIPVRNTTTSNISYCIVRLGPYSDN